jgi:hypothetical protein
VLYERFKAIVQKNKYMRSMNIKGEDVEPVLCMCYGDLLLKKI